MAFLLFDLDDTLYRSPGLRAARDRAIMAAAARTLAVSPDEARVRFREAKQAAGSTARALESLGVSRQAFWDALASVDPRTHLSRDDALCGLLARLSCRHALAVLTNSPGRAGRAVLDALGISGAFTAVLGADEVPAPKPSREAFKAMLGLLAADPRQCVMVGNTAEKDILPAKELGMRTVLVGGEDARADFSIASLAELEQLPL
jgi:HAD superfamily hydrolase (TIGR01549 family)